MGFQGMSFIFCLAAITLHSSNHLVHGANVDPENVTFELFTLRNKDTPQILKLDDLPSLLASNYNASWPLTLFAHGMDEGPNISYPMKDEYFKRGDWNFLAVDWSVLAAESFAEVQSTGAPIAGATTGAFLNFLIRTVGIPFESTHLIGFSGGVGVVAIAGRAVNQTVGRKLPRITGLEAPARTDLYAEIYLGLDDGEFIDTMHTSIPTRDEPHGHAEFFVNGGGESSGGTTQPGCSGSPEDPTNLCSHLRAVDLYTESINSPIGFVGRLCDSYDNFLAGLCNEAPTALMGEPARPENQGVYHVATNAEPPFAQG